MSLSLDSAPTITVRVNGHGSTFNFGQRTSLDCVISGHGSLNAMVQYSWLQNNIVIIIGESQSTLTLLSLRSAEHGSYKCQANVYSSLLSMPIIQMSENEHRIAVTGSHIYA